MTESTDGTLASLSLETFFGQAASTEPVPGGGCVSAVCGYLAVAILLKSIRVSAKSHPEDSSLALVDSKLGALAAQLLGLAQTDSDSFHTYMQALHLPKSNPDEVLVRKEAIRRAAIGAADAALNILDTGNQVLDIAHQVQGRISATILADEKSTVELVSAMNSTAEWNAASNLAALPTQTTLVKRLAEAKGLHASLLAACRAA